jgi:hypothetical protein
MDAATWTAGTSVLVALIGDGVLRRVFRTRAEKRTDDATATIAIQEATERAVRTVSAASEDAVRWARADAKYAKDQADEAHEEMRRLKTELTKAQTDLVRLRAEMEAEREATRQSSSRLLAERDAIILAQQAEIQRLRAEAWTPSDPRGLDLGN